MPNPMEQRTDERPAHVREGEIAAAEYSTEIGNTEPRASSARGAAGESNTAPRQLSTGEAISLLAETIADFERAGRVTAAAGISASMHKAAPGFSPKQSEFGSFRNFLHEAQRRGVIDVRRGANDFTLHTPTAAPRSSIERPERLREDLWSALLDWRETARYAYDRETRTTSAATDTLGPGQVLVPTVQRAQHIEWMRAFAQAQRADPVRLALQKALDTDDPARGFASAIRQFDAAGRRWKKTLRRLVVERAAQWATEHRIAVGDLSLNSSTDVSSNAAPLAPLPNGDAAGDAQALRQDILAVLQAMPLHELMRLPVPIEYALRR